MKEETTSESKVIGHVTDESDQEPETYNVVVKLPLRNNQKVCICFSNRSL